MLPTSFFLCSINHVTLFVFFFSFPGAHILWVNADSNDISSVSLISAGSGYHMMLSMFYDLCCVFFTQNMECLQTSFTQKAMRSNSCILPVTNLVSLRNKSDRKLKIISYKPTKSLITSKSILACISLFSAFLIHS